MMLCVRSGSLAPNRKQWSPVTCTHIGIQFDKLRQWLTIENFTPTQSASSVISTKKDCITSKCKVLQDIGDSFNCMLALEENEKNKISKETEGLILNLKMLKCSNEETTCNLSAFSCPSKSLWNNTRAFKQVIWEGSQIMQRVCA